MKRYLSLYIFLVLISTILLFGCQTDDQTTDNDNGQLTSEEPPKTLTAEDVIYTFQHAGLPIGEVIIYTEETCPNELLGRPSQYIGKASWEDTRLEQFGDDPVGGTVEVFNSQETLDARKAYLEPLITQSMFLQYMFIYKNVIVRVDGSLTPTQAEEYNIALQNTIKAQGDIIDSGNITTDEDILVEMVQSNLVTWENSIGTVWAHCAIEIKNTGTIPAKVGNITLSYLGSDNSILHTTTEIPTPDLLNPGDIAIVGTSSSFDNLNSPNEVVDIEIHIDYGRTNKTAQLLDVEDLKLINTSYDLKVTGRIINNLGESVDDINISVALYGNNNQLLAVLHEYPISKLSAGDRLGFEASSPPLPNYLETQVASLFGIAYNWVW